MVLHYVEQFCSRGREGGIILYISQEEAVWKLHPIGVYTPPLLV